jgi:hypothetical protein
MAGLGDKRVAPDENLTNAGRIGVSAVIPGFAMRGANAGNAIPGTHLSGAGDGHRA